MYMPPAQIGDAVDAIDTPALIVDLDAFERNLRKMAEFAQRAGVRLRPHAKTHRCCAIALKQIALGAVGQCCQKVGEAEALVRGGVRDVLVTNQVVDERKLRRLASLAKDAVVTLCFDAAEPVQAASRAALELGVELGGLVEIDVGMKRCGVPPGEAARDLARRIDAAPGLRFRGLQAYQGAAQHLSTYAARRNAVEQAAGQVRATVQLLEREGLRCELIGGAGTGTYPFEGGSGIWNELQTGSYIFMDAEYGAIEGSDGAAYADFENSLFVLASVMSVAVPGRAVLDAGLKSFSIEKGLPLVHGLEGVRMAGASDEHGSLTVEPGAPALALGDKVRLVPGHCDPTVNLHECFVAVRNGRVEAVWPVTPRGASR